MLYCDLCSLVLSNNQMNVTTLYLGLIAVSCGRKTIYIIYWQTSVNGYLSELVHLFLRKVNIMKYIYIYICTDCALKLESA